MPIANFRFSNSPLVIDNEIARYVRRCVRGIEVSEETLALDLIGDTGINGNTINSIHTAEHFKDELLLSPFFDVRPWGAAGSLDRDRFEKMALEKARELLSEESIPVLTKEQEQAIDEIVKEATVDLMES
ncbi:MAG: trimethylamine methyltransferase family protein [Victivallales bacterium]|jgi:trimethylamine--corrinoid protein Co-methyltransferase